MRAIATLAAALLLCSFSFSQEIFHATPLDTKQNTRLDKLEFQLERLLNQIEDAQDCNEQRLVALEADDRVVANVQPAQVIAIKPAAVANALPTLVSARYTTAELRSQIQQARPGGWRGPVYADVSPRSAAKRHLVGSDHGFSAEQINGLTEGEALVLHDLAPGHGNQIFPYRSRATTMPAVAVAQPAIATPMRTVARTVQRSSGCANGQCAKSQSSSRNMTRSSAFRFWR